MDWSLVRETGVEYAPRTGNTQTALLHFPVYAQAAKDGSCLIVDELGYEHPTGDHTRSRTLLVSRSGDVLFESTKYGVSDGFGCLTDDGHIAILSRSRWEILVLSANGSIVRKLGLWNFSKRLPRFVFCTKRQTLLVSFLDNVGMFDVIEIDQNGNLLWFLPGRPKDYGYPVGMQLLENNNILLIDAAYHNALEINRNGVIVWQWGERRQPAADNRHLSSPRSIQQSGNGTRLISDASNHRILAISRHQDISEVTPLSHDLCDPMYAEQLGNGHYLICDTGNTCVLELDQSGEIVWQYGRAKRIKRNFSFPRSIESDGNGSLLIADTAHNRVVNIAGTRVSDWPVEAGENLFWPRCARRTANGTVLIADGLNSRILEVAADGKVLHRLTHLRLPEETPLGDPHDVRLLPDGNLLLVDSSNDLVVSTDWLGHVSWMIGGDSNILKDPHSAQILDDGRVLICDSGHDRIIIVEPNTMAMESKSDFFSDTGFYRLNFPRFAEVSREGILLIADTGNSRILATNLFQEVFWELSCIPESPIPYLRYPRWAQLINHNEVIVSDHFNHRVLHLAFS